ncbi:uncharacterized protein H6S33_011185 [Morchella sextelata]|uniref:uncharacterized protein n=1 Tax=Morchella sextelata TaxID=1174677 RepID=UPI001D057406|nr:uncharacterized protein H6S33_011185 [Morchella sextelata]KAH0610758.1 hypothetical protein H6S33_011185 [Morchella sextelata]
MDLHSMVESVIGHRYPNYRLTITCHLLCNEINSFWHQVYVPASPPSFLAGEIFGGSAVTVNEEIRQRLVAHKSAESSVTIFP